VPLRPQRLDHGINNGFATALALCAKAVRVAIHTPRVAFLLHKRRARIKRVAALRAEKVAGVPLGAARDNDFALNRCLAALAARRKELVEVEVAVEA